MKYGIEIDRSFLSRIAVALSIRGYGSSSYRVSSFRPVDESDTRGDEERTVVLSNGELFVKPLRRKRCVVHRLESDSEDVIRIVRGVVDRMPVA